MAKTYLLTFTALFSFLNVSAAQAPAQWNIEKSTHFIVYYKHAPGDFIRQLTGGLEDAYNRIADDLGFRRFDFWLWDNRAKVYIFDDASDFQASTGQPAWSAGCAQVREKIIQTFPYARGFFETILPHEMGHIIFREFVGFDNRAIPLWLDEGVAVYQQKSKYAGAKALAREAMRQGNFTGLEKLSAFNSLAGADGYQAELFYAQAFSIVDFLMRQFGRSKFVIFCQNLRDKKNLEQAIASSYPFANIRELDAAWREYLNNG